MATRRYTSKSIKKNTNYLPLIGVVVVVAIIAVAAVFLIERGDEGKVRANVEKIYELLLDQQVNIVATAYENGVYRVIIELIDPEGITETQVLFVTKDGRLMTDRMIDLEVYGQGLERESNFIDCLFDKGARVVGITNNTASVLQIQALGNFGYKLYFDCGGPNLQICQDIGVQSVPSVIYNNTIYEGLKDAQWFIDITDCTF